MDFEDRLRNELHSQSSNIHVELDSPEVVARRSAVRTSRRIAALPVAALMLVGIVGGGIWASQDQGAPSESVAVIGDETSERESSPDSPDSPDMSADTTDGISLERLVTQGFSPGPELVLEDVSSPTSPGGWGIGKVYGTSGVYYVLSTAPGRPDNPGDMASYLAGTLYTYDGNDWSISGFGDRLVADFAVNPSGVLYSVSTGTTNGVAEFALGESTDGGQTWTWQALPTEGYEPHMLGPRLATKGDTTLIVSQLPMREHFAAAADLAGQAGLVIDEYDVVSATSDGIGYMVHPTSSDPCVAAEQAFWNSPDARRLQPPVPPMVPLDPTGATEEELAAFAAEMDAFEATQGSLLEDALRAAGCGQEATCREITRNFFALPENNFGVPAPVDVTADGVPDTAIDIPADAVPAVDSVEFHELLNDFYRERQLVLDQILIENGCGHEVTCRNLETAFFEDGLLSAPIEPPATSYSDELTEDEVKEMDAAWQAFFERTDAWEFENRELIDASYARHEADLEAAGCPPMVAQDLPEVKFVEWSTLGVDAPTDWSTTFVQTVSPAGVQTADLGITSYIQQIEVDGDEFALIVSNHAMRPMNDGDEPLNTEWRSVDGLNWTESDDGVPNSYNMAEVNGQRFVIDWGEGRGDDSVLYRSVIGEPGSQRIEISDLDPELSSGLIPREISGGPFGIVILASERFITAPSDDLFALFSPDGIRWSSQRLTSITQLPLFGSEALVLFEPPNSSDVDEPSAVYLGRVGE